MVKLNRTHYGTYKTTDDRFEIRRPTPQSYWVMNDTDSGERVIIGTTLRDIRDYLDSLLKADHR